MAETQQTERVVPDDLVMGFTNLSRVVWGFGIAVVLHLVIFGVTSVDTIHGIIDPAWAEAQAAAQQEAGPEGAGESAVGETLEEQMATVPEDEPGDVQAGDGEGEGAGEGEATGEEGETETAAGDELPEDVRDTPVGQRITETASPDEIPDQPDELGISIDETNPF